LLRTTSTTHRIVAGLVAVIAALALAGCAGGSRSGSDNQGAEGPASAAPGPAGQADRVSVNDSSPDDLTAALRANDVPDPAKWAQILVEYRPYPQGQAGADGIRDVLTRFEADPETAATITNAVVP
jgi:hypothetical protein